MRVFRVSHSIISLFLASGGLVAGGLVAGCGDRREPEPAEAKIPGELKVPKYAEDNKAISKDVNLKAARSIKELQSQP
jgi:hypothetical protein